LKALTGDAMLTGKMVRVRITRDRVLARYLETDSADWLDVAEQMLELFRGQEGRSRGEIDADIEEAFGSDPSQLVHQGLAKLLEDRCEFEVVAGHPPEELRSVIFRAAAAFRTQASKPPGDGQTKETGDLRLPLAERFNRASILEPVAASLGLTVDEVEQGLFADLRTEQRLLKFKDISAPHLLERYNVALAQAILLRSTRVHVAIRGESSQRYRAILRRIKFHRLICEIEKTGPDSYRLHLDGPLSLFSATQKYGLQLAMFLPAILPCRDFELRAELRWGPQKKPKAFILTQDDGLVAATDHGTYVPPELAMFVELFRKRQPDWEIIEETDLLPLGDSFWAPDFRLRHRATMKMVHLEVLGFWRRSSAEKHLERLRRYVKEPFLLAVSDSLKIDEADLEGLPASIVRFRQMPLADEVARLASELLSLPG
jgi:predicted nuclease of restriction endonuclease-like RecB superfamily